MGKTLHKDKYPEIERLYGIGLSHRAIAERVNVSQSAVTRYLQKIKPKTTDLVDYSKIPEFEGDFIIVGDVQLPTTDWDFAAKVPLVAKKFKIKNLIIAGDFINADAFSDYPDTERLPAFMEEIRAGRQLLDSWDGAFKNIYYLMGNHEVRFMRWSEGQLGAEVLGNMLHNSKLRAYNATRAVVRSGKELWRVTHQDSYRKNTGSVGQELAHKYQMNVITHHEHAVGILRDKFDHFTIVSNGGLHREEAMHYVQQYDTVRKRMSQSFVLLRRGIAHLLTPYNMTDWSMYI